MVRTTIVRRTKRTIVMRAYTARKEGRKSTVARRADHDNDDIEAMYVAEGWM